MRIAILSNVTADVLAGMLRPDHEVWLAPGFGGWMQMALEPPESLRVFSPEAVVLLLDGAYGTFGASDVEAAVSALERTLPLATVLVPDLADLADETESFYDARMWSLAAMPWSLAGLEAIRDETNRLLGLSRGGRRKVLALDFDNTLWQGVIGEDGLSGIRPDADFQRVLRDLRARGVLLVGLSRNNAADVEPVWDDPRMVLGRGDFAAWRIDWRDKCDNLDDIAAELGLGTDAFVFLDDSPAERAQMAARHPEVAVPDWPVPMRRLVRLHFPRMRLTAEDLAKTEQYGAETARRRARAAAPSLEDYLKDLDIHSDIHPIGASEYARVAQLSQKSNQFNVRTNRYTAAEIARLAEAPGHFVWTMRARDRFGDLGLVAFIHAVRSDARATEAEIVDWTMSCRAMNRRLEFTFERRIEEHLGRVGVKHLSASWRRTAKNAPVKDLFESFGFALTCETDDGKSYGLSLDRAREQP